VIVAMRAAGHTNEEIAAAVELKVGSLASYVYQATKAGVLVNKHGSLLTDPSDRLEYDLAQKVVDNLDEMLTTDRVLRAGERSQKAEVTLEIAKGVLFKKFDVVKEGGIAPMTLLSVKIEGVVGPVDVTAGGAPLYLDGVMGEDDPA